MFRESDLACLGPVDNEGVVHKCVNLGWDVVNVEKELEEKTGLLVKAGNDANVSCAR